MVSCAGRGTLRGMLRSSRLVAALAVAAVIAGCAAKGEAPPGAGPSPTTAAVAPGAPVKAGAPVDDREVAVLVLEQTPSELRVVSGVTRPRASFGPSASWNGAGAPSHSWTLLGLHGETLATGTLSARTTMEAPPNPAAGTKAAAVPLDTFAFDVRVPAPAPGEHVEIASLATPTLKARWP